MDQSSSTSPNLTQLSNNIHGVKAQNEAFNYDPMMPINDITEEPKFEFDAFELLDLLVEKKEETTFQRTVTEEAPMPELTSSSSLRPEMTLATSHNQLPHNNVDKEQPHRKELERAPPAKPRRPLSAYNLFFKYERTRLLMLSERGESVADHPPSTTSAVDTAEIRKLLSPTDNKYHVDHKRRRHRKTHGAISFSELFQMVLRNWKGLSDEARAPFEEIAGEIKAQYDEDASAYRAWKRRDQWRKTKARSRARKRKVNKKDAAPKKQKSRENILSSEKKSHSSSEAPMITLPEAAYIPVLSSPVKSFHAISERAFQMTHGEHTMPVSPTSTCGHFEADEALLSYSTPFRDLVIQDKCENIKDLDMLTPLQW
mmetsp:Transcript_22091/g.41169  ORF Transcript_22091/g.41169 Transcript_22091/m.41169 type:complete len:371 (-) Transcript_22091:183-1295(-)